MNENETESDVQWFDSRENTEIKGKHLAVTLSDVRGALWRYDNEKLVWSLKLFYV